VTCTMVSKSKLSFDHNDNEISYTLKVHYVSFGLLVVKKQNCMHFAEERSFGCASALCDCADEYGSFS